MYVREGIGILLLLLGLLRASLLVMHEPVVGYAPQADMLRVAACHGLYPGAAGQARAGPEAPVAFYRRDAAAKEGCYADSDTILVAAVLATARTLRIDDQGIALKWIGLAKLGLLFATALAVPLLGRDETPTARSFSSCSPIRSSPSGSTRCTRSSS